MVACTLVCLLLEIKVGTSDIINSSGDGWVTSSNPAALDSSLVHGVFSRLSRPTFFSFGSKLAQEISAA